MTRGLVVIARLFYWVSGFALLAAVVTLVLHLTPAVYNNGDGQATIGASWNLVIILGVTGVVTWLAAQVLAAIAARRINQHGYP
jgi:hypothetical protein